MENTRLLVTFHEANCISTYCTMMALNRHICMILSFYNCLMCECVWESWNFKMNYFWYVFPFTHITYNFCRLDLLPFYARLVATLHPCMSDVAEDLCSMLRGDFRFHVCIYAFILLYLYTLISWVRIFILLVSIFLKFRNGLTVQNEGLLNF